MILHTPSPWHVDRVSDTSVYVRSSADKMNRVAKIELLTRVTEEEELANAQLIAISPDLLAFAKSFLEKAESPESIAELINTAKELIIKANGNLNGEWKKVQAENRPRKRLSLLNQFHEKFFTTAALKIFQEFKEWLAKVNEDFVGDGRDSRYWLAGFAEGVNFSQQFHRTYELAELDDVEIEIEARLKKARLEIGKEEV